MLSVASAFSSVSLAFEPALSENRLTWDNDNTTVNVLQVSSGTPLLDQPTREDERRLQEFRLGRTTETVLRGVTGKRKAVMGYGV